MRILVHICCGPCSITVLRSLTEAGNELCGFFFNPNIHPLAEYMRRREGAGQVAARLGVPVLYADAMPEREQVWSDPWLEHFALTGAGGFSGESEPAAHAPAFVQPPAADPRPWLGAVAGRESSRCLFCWRSRLRKTAETAVAQGFAGFSTTLLYSRHQDHERIRALGQAIAEETGIAFVYEDFRPSWQEGIRISREWDIYRQQYCGCVFSEYDRYRRDFQRMAAVAAKGSALGNPLAKGSALGTRWGK